MVIKIVPLRGVRSTAACLDLVSLILIAVATMTEAAISQSPFSSAGVTITTFSWMYITCWRWSNFHENVLNVTNVGRWAVLTMPQESFAFSFEHIIAYNAATLWNIFPPVDNVLYQCWCVVIKNAFSPNMSKKQKNKNNIESIWWMTQKMCPRAK